MTEATVTVTERPGRPLLVAFAGFLPGVLLNAAPPLLLLLYFHRSATPDSGFNLLALGTAALLLVDAALLIAALVALFKPAARSCAAGYLTAVFAVVVTLVAITPFVG